MVDLANMTIAADGTIVSWNAKAESTTGFPASNIVGRHFSEVINFGTCSLGENDAMFRRIVETTSEGIWTIGLDGLIQYANPRLAEMLGYPREDIVGKAFSNFVHADEHTAIETLLKESQAGQSSLLKRRFLRSDGSVLWARVASSPIPNHLGHVIGRLGIVTDLSERKLTEDERDQFFVNSLDLVGVADANGHFLKLNPEFERALGWSLPELLAKPYMDLVHPEDVDQTRKELGKMARGEPSLGCENRYRCRDGSYKWLSWRTSKILDGRSYFVARDVTEQKLSAQRLRKSAEMQSALAELGSLALQKVSLQTVFNACVELSAKVTGYEFGKLSVFLSGQKSAQIAATYGWAEDAFPQNTKIAISPDTQSGYTLAIGKIIYFEDVEHETRFDTSYLRQWGVRCGLSILVPRQDDNYGVLSLHSRERHRISIREIHFLQSMANVLGNAAERRQLETQLKTSDRLASVGALAAGVAHEINNPMSFVITNLDLIASLLASNPTDKIDVAQILDMLSQAQHGAERVRLVVKDLKTFSSSSDDKLEPLKLENILNFSVRMAANQIRYRAKLVTNCDASPTVMINENRLGQVLLNILINAAQAIPEGAADRNEIKVQLGTDTLGNAFIEVSDTGTGIPESLMSQIFDPFFTTKPIGTGTGLGLTICRNIITKLNGELTIQSREGLGTKVRITLPAAVDQNATANVTRIDLPVPLLNMVRRKVLILDDEALLVKTLGRALANDHIVSTTVSPTEAIKMIGNDQEAFDVIFCDLMMAEMTGMDFYHQLKIRFPGTESRVIFMTGGSFTVQARQFLNDVPNIRLEKPFNLKEIRALLQQPLTTLWRERDGKIG